MPKELSSIVEQAALEELENYILDYAQRVIEFIKELDRLSNNKLVTSKEKKIIESALPVLKQIQALNAKVTNKLVAIVNNSTNDTEKKIKGINELYKEFFTKQNLHCYKAYSELYPSFSAMLLDIQDRLSEKEKYNGVKCFKGSKPEVWSLTGLAGEPSPQFITRLPMLWDNFFLPLYNNCILGSDDDVEIDHAHFEELCDTRNQLSEALDYVNAPDSFEDYVVNNTKPVFFDVSEAGLSDFEHIKSKLWLAQAEPGSSLQRRASLIFQTPTGSYNYCSANFSPTSLTLHFAEYGAITIKYSETNKLLKIRLSDYAKAQFRANPAARHALLSALIELQQVCKTKPGSPHQITWFTIDDDSLIVKKKKLEPLEYPTSKQQTLWQRSVLPALKAEWEALHYAAFSKQEHETEQSKFEAIFECAERLYIRGQIPKDDEFYLLIRKLVVEKSYLSKLSQYAKNKRSWLYGEVLSKDFVKNNYIDRSIGFFGGIQNAIQKTVEETTQEGIKDATTAVVLCQSFYREEQLIPKLEAIIAEPTTQPEQIKGKEESRDAHEINTTFILDTSFASVGGRPNTNKKRNVLSTEQHRLAKKVQTQELFKTRYHEQITTTQEIICTLLYPDKSKKLPKHIYNMSALQAELESLIKDSNSFFGNEQVDNSAVEQQVLTLTNCVKNFHKEIVQLRSLKLQAITENGCTKLERQISSIKENAIKILTQLDKMYSAICQGEANKQEKQTPALQYFQAIHEKLEQHKDTKQAEIAFIKKCISEGITIDNTDVPESASVETPTSPSKNNDTHTRRRQTLSINIKSLFADNRRHSGSSSDNTADRVTLAKESQLSAFQVEYFKFANLCEEYGHARLATNVRDLVKGIPKIRVTSVDGNNHEDISVGVGVGVGVGVNPNIDYDDVKRQIKELIDAYTDNHKAKPSNSGPIPPTDATCTEQKNHGTEAEETPRDNIYEVPEQPQPETATSDNRKAKPSNSGPTPSIDATCAEQKNDGTEAEATAHDDIIVDIKEDYLHELLLPSFGKIGKIAASISGSDEQQKKRLKFLIDGFPGPAALETELDSQRKMAALLFNLPWREYKIRQLEALADWITAIDQYKDTKEYAQSSDAVKKQFASHVKNIIDNCFHVVSAPPEDNTVANSIDTIKEVNKQLQKHFKQQTLYQKLTKKLQIVMGAGLCLMGLSLIATVIVACAFGHVYSVPVIKPAVAIIAAGAKLMGLSGLALPQLLSGVGAVSTSVGVGVSILGRRRSPAIKNRDSARHALSLFRNNSKTLKRAVLKRNVRLQRETLSIIAEFVDNLNSIPPAVAVQEKELLSSLSKCLKNSSNRKNYNQARLQLASLIQQLQHCTALTRTLGRKLKQSASRPSLFVRVNKANSLSMDKQLKQACLSLVSAAANFIETQLNVGTANADTLTAFLVTTLAATMRHEQADMAELIPSLEGLAEGCGAESWAITALLSSFYYLKLAKSNLHEEQSLLHDNDHETVSDISSIASDDDDLTQPVDGSALLRRASTRDLRSVRLSVQTSCQRFLEEPYDCSIAHTTNTAAAPRLNNQR